MLLGAFHVSLGLGEVGAHPDGLFELRVRSCRAAVGSGFGSELTVCSRTGSVHSPGQIHLFICSLWFLLEAGLTMWMVCPYRSIDVM
jgi:hypothetical protein